MPARNAPSAIEAPNSLAAAAAIPSASTSTVSVKSSRERVAAICASSQGTSRRPPYSITATSSPILSTEIPSESAIRAAPWDSARNRTGNITSTNTVTRSSTTSQPTAMCPTGVCKSCASASTRKSTTVLATEIATPNTIPAHAVPPNAISTAPATRLVTTIWPSRPGTAIRRTASRSFK